MKNENTLLDLAAEMLKAKNDAQLSRALCISPPVISKIRHARLPVGAGLVIKLHEATGLTVREIKSYITHGPMAARVEGMPQALGLPYTGQVHKGTMHGAPGNFQNLPKETK